MKSYKIPSNQSYDKIDDKNTKNNTELSQI